MNNTNNINKKWFWTKFWVGFFAVVAIGFAMAILIKQGMGEGSGSNGSAGASSPVSSSQADDIAVVNALDGSGHQIVDDKTGNYHFAMPTSWYLEKNAGLGLTIYPDYSPASSSSPTCKIEISRFPVASGTDLNDWLTKYFAADPTADITQTSLSQIAIQGAKTALEWRGTMNSATTTLVYAQGVDEILEIAPSSLSQASDADNDDCDDALQQFLLNLTLGNYGKNI